MSGAGLICSMLDCRLLGSLWIFFYYIMICPVSSAYTIGVVSFAWPRYIGCWLWTGHCSSYLFSGYLFPALFANQILVLFHVSIASVPGFVSCAFTVCWLTFNRLLFRFYCISHYLLTKHWFAQCQKHLYIGVILQYNSGSMAATLNKSRFQYVHFSPGYCVFTSF